MTKSLYILGLVAFIWSFFEPTTPQVMTSSEGEAVALWETPFGPQLDLALAPVLLLYSALTVTTPEGAQGDGTEIYRRECLYRALYSLPAACGWFVIWASLLFMPWDMDQRIGIPRVRLGMKVGGWLLLASVPMLSWDYYGHVTTYTGYFHLGLGAYLIVLAYLFVGTSLLLRLARPHVPPSTMNASAGPAGNLSGT